MAPRDVPDSSNIISTKRRPKKPRAPDEVVSLAPPARPLAPQVQLVDSGPPDSMVGAIQSPSPPVVPSPSPIFLSNPTIRQPSPLPTLIISPPASLDRGGEQHVLTEIPSAADSIVRVASPTSSRGGTTRLPVQVSEREPTVANKSGAVPICQSVCLHN